MLFLTTCHDFGICDFLPFPYLRFLVRSFLNDVDRIATKSYKPSDDDVVRARLRTLGVQEHHFTFEEGALLILNT